MQNYNLVSVNQGNTYSGAQFTLPSVSTCSLTGATIKMQVRSAPGARIMLELSNATGGKISIVSQYVFAIAAHTVNIPPGTYQYDIKIVFSDGREKTYIGGTWTIEPVITLTT